ncbi:HIT family protein [Dokdonia sinensis]|uniref:HIT family protein n=1 Tax=Dokdonia sinensis TaxID=2479847 RepID=A0A3M0GLB3_9FLAO|nr:HIT family protein [Dokdonia sinensis]RMB63462.1 HIT family protein [Dokdonia sinensis]
MPSIFTKIINREIPGHIVHEDDHHIAILDINPNTKGHTLCIPKKEVNKIFDLSDEDYLALMAYAKKIAVALEKAVSCKRIGMSVIGLEVPHVHVHLLPLQSMEDMRFVEKVKMEKEEFEGLTEEIKQYL